ncbi:hypothetical protein TUM4644_02040 [Shewanella colwelliana]|uniref:Uncharacterized protein n=1 Tax=Shewanella colwelliana TaxID=23 RepID=A0A1E5IYF6_SHECO|nr:hypothetical protein [Shewanella colwelliana]MDX1281404.1 hypothetical protein [Shewanella colwelliana]OEG75580.1 hypothetical protein BEL05_17300 [Shewanella colwelliana]GIU17138.1 hypothetical protein TUM4644_02040 [Shewanella colwelliana]GIU39319.1 hypothetical protein TUM3794_13860 [Shewanella colwelliana]
MESIICFDEIMDLTATPEHKLQRYRACLHEFERLNYEDPFIRQIRTEVARLEQELSLRPKQQHYFLNT